MKPGDHPEFFRFPAPGGASRESTIGLDAHGRFYHDGERVQHPGLAKALATWVSKHPDDGRFILTNGYDWCYFTVEATPFFVTGVHATGEEVTIDLFDGTSEPLNPAALRIDEEGVLRSAVKNGDFEARFGRQAQLQMEPLLDEEAGQLVVLVGGRRHAIAH